MWPDWVLNPGPLTYESGVLPTALCGPALKEKVKGELFGKEVLIRRNTVFLNKN